MNCKNCGKPINSGDKFCNYCGMSVTDPNNQINFSQLNNNQPSSHKPTSSKNIVLIIIGVIILAVIIGIVIIALTTLFIIGKVGSDIAANQDIGEMLDGTYKVNVGDYEFIVPESYEVEVEDNSMMIESEDSDWMSNIELVEGSYEATKQDSSKLKAELEAEGLIVNSDAKIETYNGREYINIDVVSYSMNFMISYTKLDNNTVLVLTSLNEDNTYNYSVLDKVEPILASAKKAGSSDSETEKDIFSDIINKN